MFSVSCSISLLFTPSDLDCGFTCSLSLALSSMSLTNLESVSLDINEV